MRVSCILGFRRTNAGRYAYFLPVPSVCHGSKPTSNRDATSAGGCMASCRSATSASASINTRHGSMLRLMFHETTFSIVHEHSLTVTSIWLPARGKPPADPTRNQFDRPNGDCFRHATASWLRLLRLRPTALRDNVASHRALEAYALPDVACGYQRGAALPR